MKRITLALPFILIVASLGCIAEQDPHTGFYFYIGIHTNSTEEYQVRVPLPDVKTHLVIDGEVKWWEPVQYTDDIEIKTGSCEYRVVVNNSKSYLEINGSSTVLLSSEYKQYDAPIDSTFKGPSNGRVKVFSSTSNISVIIDSRTVVKTDWTNHWKLDYSAVMAPEKQYPQLTQDTWKEHLPFEYYFTPGVGWDKYDVIWEDEVKIYE